MMALVDCNNFYVSCERSFNPDLEGRAVVVLSNNDGCVISRSNEAKAMGITMGVPFFQLVELRKENDIRFFSSNYALYGDMSARVMATLGRFVEEVEVNSIDEAFLNLLGYETAYPDLAAFAQTLRSTIRQWTRIPVSIGIAPTKTLTKIANYFAKSYPKYEGVMLLDTPERINAALTYFKVENLWGIGRQYADLLRRNGIDTAAKFAALPDDWISDRLTVNGLRVAYELRGVPCKLLEPDTQPKKSICTAPSFGRSVYDFDTLNQALITHLSRAAQKLRKQQSAASSITVFAHTNRHKRSFADGDRQGVPVKQYYNSRSTELPHPTDSTHELAQYAHALLKSIFVFGYDYQKVGLMLTGLVPAGHQQGHLFTDAPDGKLSTLSHLMDAINHRYGRDKVRLAGAGYDSSWHNRRDWRSPGYTTDWNGILKAR